MSHGPVPFTHTRRKEALPTAREGLGAAAMTHGGMGGRLPVPVPVLAGRKPPPFSPFPSLFPPPFPGDAAIT